MLDDKICKMREKLNKSITMGEDYEKIYSLSIALDELIIQYYKKNKKSDASNMGSGITNDNKDTVNL